MGRKAMKQVPGQRGLSGASAVDVHRTRAFIHHASPSGGGSVLKRSNPSFTPALHASHRPPSRAPLAGFFKGVPDAEHPKPPIETETKPDARGPCKPPARLTGASPSCVVPTSEEERCSQFARVALLGAHISMHPPEREGSLSLADAAAAPLKPSTTIAAAASGSGSGGFTTAKALFTTAKQAMAKEAAQAPEEKENPAKASKAATSVPLPPRSFNPPQPSSSPGYDKEEWLKRKRAREEKAEQAKAARVRGARQCSIVTSIARAADRCHRITRVGPSLSADILPTEQLQRVLAYLPPALIADVRRVSKSWRDAVDDPGFMPYTKMATRLRAAAAAANSGSAVFDGDSGIAADASSVSGGGVQDILENVGAYMLERGMTDVPGIIQYVAHGHKAWLPSARLFNSPLAADALAAAVETREARARARAGDAVVVGHVPGSGLGGAVRELARWRMTRGDGWGTLAAAVLTTAEDQGTMAVLLAAAEEAAGSEASVEAGSARPSLAQDYCVREDLTEFVHLLAAAMSSSLSWSPRGATSRELRGSTFRLTATAARLAHLEAAAGYLELAGGATASSLSGGKNASIASAGMTHEQHAIVSTDLREDQIMLVRAFAGTGKTTTLIQYVRRRPGFKFAYLTFNRQIMLEAQTKFPMNTTCLNFHKLAYAKYGWMFRDKMQRGALRPNHAAKALGLATSDERAVLALRTLEMFLRSAEREVGNEHLPPSAHVKEVYGKQSVKNRLPAGVSPEEDLKAMATALWAAMKEKTNTMPMTDGGYLKMYQLSKPRLDLVYDVVMLDEAQDAAPVMADIVMQQPCAKILVGDPHQEIYSFMGAKNAMAAVAAAVPRSRIVERSLARSFRFGYEIASVANSLLRLKGETACVLGARRESGRLAGLCPEARESGKKDDEGEEEDEGLRVIRELREAEESAAVLVMNDLKRESLLQCYAPPRQSAQGSSSGGGQNGQLVVLCRGNGSLFEVASKVVDMPRVRVGVVGGLEGLKLTQLEDIWRLSTGREEELLSITDKYIKSFAKQILDHGGCDPGYGTLGPLKHVSILQDDKDMQTKISIVEKLGNRLPALLERLQAVDVGDKHHTAHFLLSTAHKAKGLEFPTVLLWDDFAGVASLVNRHGDGSSFITHTNTDIGEVEEEVSADEVNLVYVAATRAMRRLILYPSLARLHAGRGVHSNHGKPSPMAVLRPVRLDSTGGGGGSFDPEASAHHAYGVSEGLEEGFEAGPTKCLGCMNQAREAVSANHEAGARFGLAVLNSRSPCIRATMSSALGYHQAMSGQWWGASAHLTELQRTHHETHQKGVQYREDVTGTRALTPPFAGAWKSWVCWECVQRIGRGLDREHDEHHPVRVLHQRGVGFTELLSVEDIYDVLAAEKEARESFERA